MLNSVSVNKMGPGSIWEIPYFFKKCFYKADKHIRQVTSKDKQRQARTSKDKLVNRFEGFIFLQNVSIVGMITFLQFILTNISYVNRGDSRIPILTSIFFCNSQSKTCPSPHVPPIGIYPWSSIRPAPLPPPVNIPPEPCFRVGQGGQELVHPVVSHGGQVSAVLGPTLLPGFSPGQALCELLVTFTIWLKFSPSRATTLIQSRKYSLYT